MYFSFMDVIPFKFQNVALRESCWIDRKPYFTGRSIGEFLEVRHPDRYVHKIVERNPHILPFSRLINIPITQSVGREHTRQIDEGAKLYEREIEVRVYDPVGLQLIINKSNQPKAILFQVAVAHLVLAYMRGDLRPCRPTHQRFFIAMKGFEDAEKTAHGHRMESWEKAAFESGRSIKTLYRWRKRFKERGTLCYDYRYKSN